MLLETYTISLTDIDQKGCGHLFLIRFLFVKKYSLFL